MKKLIPAIVLLLISAMIMATASYAWFSMNTQVTATGMQVKAKSNATYLLIGDAKDAGTTATELQTAALTTDTAHYTGVGKEFYPADYTNVNIGSAVGANSWYTCNNGSTSSATGSELNHKTLIEKVSTDADYETSDFAKYVLANSFCLVLTADSEAWAGGLKITVDETDAKECVKTIVKVNSNYYPFDADGNVTINSIGISATQVIRVDVFTFIDGTSANVYTDYEHRDELVGSIELAFDLVENVTTP